jgi:hypothetical protein
MCARKPLADVFCPSAQAQRIRENCATRAAKDRWSRLGARACAFQERARVRLS